MPRFRSVSPWHGFGRGVAALIGLAAAGFAAAHFDLVLVWMIPACLLGLLLGAWSAGGTGTASFAAAILFAGFAMTIGLVPTAVLTASEIAGPLPASGMTAHPSALGYRLADSRIASEFSASRTFRETRTGGVPSTWHAAPLVDSGWSRERPVPAWIIAQENAGTDPSAASSRRRWSDSLVSVLRIAAPSSGRAPDAVALAMERHGLTSAPGAVLVMRSDDPAQDRLADQRLVLMLLAAAIAGHGLIVWRPWERRGSAGRGE